MSKANLTPEQNEVVTRFGCGMAVLAGAGCGKTTTLVSKCIELVRQNPEARFAAVSFTEKSASDLRSKLATELPLAGHWVTTIHGLCSRIIRENPRQAGLDGEETILTGPEAELLWTRAIESLWAQDLAPEIMSACERLLARESRISLEGLLARIRELEIFGILEALEGAISEDARALAQVGRYVMERYERGKRRRGVLDFSDLERGALRAFEDPGVRDAYRKRFGLVLVDEFQDTNAVQAAILKGFAREDLSNLCVVGDPKQSIYRFRDADVAIFDEFCAKLPLNLRLTRNFRSRPAIIEFANRVCAPAFEASEADYEPLVAEREADEGAVPVGRLSVSEPIELAQFIRGEMSRGTPLHDMALLLRKIRGNEKWLKALSQSGIPIAVGSGGLFWEDPRTREMVAFLKAWDNGGNKLSSAVFLRAPWVGVADQAIDDWIRLGANLLDMFLDSDHVLARRLRPLRTTRPRPAELLLALLVDERTENELGAPLLGLWHRVEELSSRGLDFHAVVTELARSSEESRRERDVPPPRNSGQLTVLTLHGSKGLEFPVVFLVDFNEKAGRAPDSPLLYWDREEGAFFGPRDSDGERDTDDAEEQRWREREKKKNLAELKRLFYVALTRARERLILVLPKEDPIIDPAKDPLLLDYWTGWVLPAIRELEIPELETERSPVAVAEREVKPKARHLPLPEIRAFRPRYSVTEWNTLHRCPRAYEWSSIRPVTVTPGVPEMGLYTGERIETFTEREVSQKDLGTRVHECLERGDYEGLKKVEELVGAERFQAEPVISWAMSSPWMAPAKDDGTRDVWPELSFEMPIGGQTLVGSLDRVVRQESSSGAQFTLIDFKVTEKMKSVEALLEAYEAQIWMYSEALNRLEPSSRGRTEALIVNISPRTIQTIPISFGSENNLSEKIGNIALEADSIVSGISGRAKPGPLCRVCQFRPLCSEGKTYHLSQ